MRDAIAKDVQAESHYECAICGRGDHNELAHIHDVADSASNSPDNLLFLCPNHHTAYDLGFKRGSNVKAAAIEAAKLLKRESRGRILLHEANAAKAMLSLIQFVKKIEERLTKLDDEQLTQKVYDKYDPEKLNEVDCPRCDGAGKIGWNNEPCAYCKGSCFVSREQDERYDPQKLDEEACPRCGGSGRTGLVGDSCGLCKGDCVVSHAIADEYRKKYS